MAWRGGHVPSAVPARWRGSGLRRHTATQLQPKGRGSVCSRITWRSQRHLPALRGARPCTWQGSLPLSAAAPRASGNPRHGKHTARPCPNTTAPSCAETVGAAAVVGSRRDGSSEGEAGGFWCRRLGGRSGALTPLQAPMPQSRPIPVFSLLFIRRRCPPSHNALPPRPAEYPRSAHTHPQLNAIVESIFPRFGSLAGGTRLRIGG